MSSAPEGWYVDPSTGTNLRFWSGSTWTDEVAPMPYEPAHSGEVDLFAAAAGAEAAAEPGAEASTDASADASSTEAKTDASSTEGLPEAALESADLDPEIEHTMLTRRELRARRGSDIELDDAPKHLPPMAAPTAVSIEQWQEPVEELEIPAPEVPAPPEPEADDPTQRRHRIIRMSVLLGILAVASSVAVLTAGTL